MYVNICMLAVSDVLRVCIQLWSANDADVSSALLDEFARSGVKPWNATIDPDYIEPGLVLRLGPVWKTRYVCV
jgi:hypothetical protein